MKKVIIITCIFLISLSVKAQWSTDPTVNTAICTASGNQDQQQICPTSNGGAIIVWRDSRNGSNDIYAQKLNAVGAVQWTPDGVVICTSANTQQFPKIVSDGSGGAIISWQDNRSGTYYDIYAQRINSSGTVQWVADGVAICTSANEQQYPTIISDGYSGAIFTWQDKRGGTYFDVYAQSINSSGTVQWTVDGVAICSATNNQYYPTITSDDSGAAIITWYDHRNGANNHIYAQRINSSGTVQWATDGVVICIVGTNQFVPTITSDGSSGAIITWQDNRSGIYYDIYAQKISSIGTVQWTSNGVIICAAVNDQSDQTIVSDGSGGAIITWTDYRNGLYYHIYAQRVNSSGIVQWTADGVAICTARRDQYSQNIISDGSGGAIITWEDYTTGTTKNIYAQKINSAGTVQWVANGMTICTATREQFAPTINTDGSDGAIITWSDIRNNLNLHIYAQKIYSSGVLASTPPTISTFSPLRNTTASLLSQNIVLGWNTNMSSFTSGNIVIRGSMTGPKYSTAGTFTTSGATVTLDPATNFKPGELISVTVIGAISSLGNQTTQATIYSFMAAARAGIGSFTLSSTASVGSAPQSVAVGDFNNDGTLDFVTGNWGAGTASLRLGDGTGGFSGGSDVSVGTWTQSVAVGDFNGDGFLDIVAASWMSKTIAVRLGDGTGGFSGGSDMSFGNMPFSVAVGDFNGDGKLDFAETDYSDGTVSIRLGDGTGGFSGGSDTFVGTGTSSVAVGDFNGDGILDFVAASTDNNYVAVGLGNGAGGFTLATNVAVGSQPQGVAVGDLNGDGVLDFATANYGANTVSICLGNGLGGFGTATDYSVGSHPYSVTVGDFNGDRKLDFCAANISSGSASIGFGDGTGGFSSVSNVSVGGGGPLSVAIGDFNGDGYLDFASANNGSDNVSILLGDAPPISVNIKVILEGPYSSTSGTMQTVLRTYGYLPTSQPYNATPWNYSVSQTVAGFPANCVDWILLEFRTAPTALPVYRTAALLRNDGQITSTAGTAPLQISTANLPAGQYYTNII